MADVKTRHHRRVLLAEKFLLVTGTLLLGFAVLLIYATGTARSHSWYPHECCSSTDCEPLAEDQIKITSEGYVLPNGELVKHGTTRPSQDGPYHWCRHLIEPRMLIRKDPVCLFVPEGGV